MSGAERGLILEVEGRHAVVLTRGGEFRRVRLDRPGRQVGEEMVLPAERGWLPRWAPAGGRFGLPRVAVALAVAAALALALLPSTLFRPSGGSPGEQGVPTPAIVAYVSVDINPSIELGLDAAGRVVAAQALNAEAVPLLQRVGWRGRSLPEVLSALALAAVDDGFLAPGRDNAVVIAAVSAGEGARLPDAVEQHVQEGRRQVEAVLARRSLEAQVGVLRAEAPRLRAEADQAGLSLGKYLILLEARKAGLDVSAREIREQPVGRLLRERGAKPGEIIRRAAEERGFEDLARRFQGRLGLDEDNTLVEDGSVLGDTAPEDRVREADGDRVREGVEDRERGGGGRDPERDRGGERGNRQPGGNSGESGIGGDRRDGDASGAGTGGRDQGDANDRKDGRSDECRKGGKGDNRSKDGKCKGDGRAQPEGDPGSSPSGTAGGSGKGGGDGGEDSGHEEGGHDEGDRH